MNKLDTKLNDRKEELLARTSEIFGITVEEAEILFRPKKMSLTVTKKIYSDFIEDNLRTEKLTKIPWNNNGYIIEGDKYFFTHSKEFEEANIYLQNASSFLPTLALDPKAGEIVLDMCAAPGGKTLNIANATNNKAEIYVNDENNTRIQNMRKMFELYGVNIKSYYSQPAQYLSKHLPAEHFDKILIDAPCSGEGLINLHDIRTLGYWSTKKIKRLNGLQKSIIAEGYKLLKSGGTMVYSTCTLAPEENELVINWALENFKDLKIVEMEIKSKVENATNGITKWKDKELSKDLTKCLRVKPNDYMEAFFVCKLQKDSK
jgi:tRNA (cytosine49-C5)-methyltransferase